ncbi:hypothetical protein AHF37_02941 [Paragonimus kellicotti]|nr:hypothetical protein AHF37_02941 [Paragonimus kellicotti]
MINKQERYGIRNFPLHLDHGLRTQHILTFFPRKNIYTAIDYRFLFRQMINRGNTTIE